MKEFFKASPTVVSLIQAIVYIGTILGFFYFTYDLSAILMILLGYFLYGGIGLMMLHRYYTHKSFEFKNNFIKWLFTWFALTLGRGSIIGWVHVHREHHAFSDTPRDPHYPNLRFRSIFFPTIKHCGTNINKKIIRDLYNQTQLRINNYYVLIIGSWILLLGLINPWLLYFGWCVPVLLTHIMINAFVYLGHRYGYVTYDCRDDSRNLWVFGYLLWGEGWHNNHHKHAKNWNFGEKWWEIDLMAPIIWMVKK